MEKENQFTLSASVIIISKDKKALILQRPSHRRVFGNEWTVPGGKVQTNDGTPTPKGCSFRYFVCESCAIRELQEETSIQIDIKDLIHLCTIVSDSKEFKRFVASYYAILNKNAEDVKIVLSEERAYKWITQDQIKMYEFIPDIGSELEQVFQIVEKHTH